MHWAVSSIPAFLGGFCAGVIANPIDLVYNRQVSDHILPDKIRRNYKSFFDGIMKAHNEGVLFRGAVAGGLAIGALHASMFNVYDYLKEYGYFFFGPTHWLRPACLIPTAAFGVVCYLPFDNIRTRMHTMFELPYGELPYKGTFDAFKKILMYECSLTKYSSPIAFLNGGTAAFMKIYMTLIIVFFTR